ncbi:peptide/nickel transport system permease protein [Kitasatospora sp. MAP12-15]|uniref:ABC transporter permease n=1 Tax=unclassified Kitasatospora TaxID=2633591 RepID=UPI002476FDAC|nr:ABC transporter permease [Kitasatospora sp. MAP12-44]MDH6109539.1 peptide/nickel transport system permease protein [Kitasatospora sp. MAP12-44]
MTSFLIRRLFGVAVTLLVVCAVTFCIFYLLPADPATQFCGKDCAPDQVALIRKQMGLSAPLIVQFGHYVQAIFAGRTMGSGNYAVQCHFPCFGYSFQTGRPVWDLMMDRLPTSASLAIGAAVIWLLLGLGAGVLSALRKNTWIDRTLMVGTIGVAALPVYFTAMILLYVVVSVLGLMPYPRYVAFTDDPVGWLQNLLLPWITLALTFAAIYARMTRSSVIETLAEPYVRTARAKGLPERRVVGRHGLRPALTPIATMLGMDLGGLLAGALITESLFGLPGVGKLFADSLAKSDQPVVMGITLLASFFIIMSNLVVDLVYAWIDPRARVA